MPSNPNEFRRLQINAIEAEIAKYRTAQFTSDPAEIAAAFEEAAAVFPNALDPIALAIEFLTLRAESIRAQLTDGA